MPLTQNPAVEIGVERIGHIAVVELRRPPHNYFDQVLVEKLADLVDVLGNDSSCRAIVLAAQGKSFCAGGDQSRAELKHASDAVPKVPGIYRQALRLFRSTKPIVAAVHGAAVGGGLGLALVADFRVTCPEARFWANFSMIGLHAGFGLTATLPRLIGAQRSAELLFTGRRISGTDAAAIGLADFVVPADEVRARAVILAQEIAQAAPLAVQAMRATLRAGLAEKVERAIHYESLQQARLRQTADCHEGVRAMAERRQPQFSSK